MKRSVRRGGIALLAVVPVVVWLSSWSIEEARFSPYTLEYQKRKSLVVFTGEVPLYRGGWEPASNEVLAYITRSKYVEPMPTDDPHWDLVHRFKTGQEGGWKRPYHSLQPAVVAWSERHPDVAPLFWQAGYSLVRSESENEIEAGYQLLGRLWEHCDSVSDLKRLLFVLEHSHRIDAMKKLPAAIISAKLEPSKSIMLAPNITPQPKMPGKSGKKKDGKAKPAPQTPKQSPVNSPPAN